MQMISMQINRYFMVGLVSLVACVSPSCTLYVFSVVHLTLDMELELASPLILQKMGCPSGEMQSVNLMNC